MTTLQHALIFVFITIASCIHHLYHAIHDPRVQTLVISFHASTLTIIDYALSFVAFLTMLGCYCYVMNCRQGPTVTVIVTESEPIVFQMDYIQNDFDDLNTPYYSPSDEGNGVAAYDYEERYINQRGG